MKSIFTIILYIEIIKSHDKPLSLHLWIAEWLPLTWEVFVVCETMFECVSVFSRSNLLCLSAPLRRARRVYFLFNFSFRFHICFAIAACENHCNNHHRKHIECTLIVAAWVLLFGMDWTRQSTAYRSHIHKNEKQKNPFNSFMEKK